MPWASLLKYIIPYIWDVFIKSYDEEGNPVLWSKPMLIGVILVLVFGYYNLYSYIHESTENEHEINIKNTEIIKVLSNKNNTLEIQLSDIKKDRDSIHLDLLRTKTLLNETRLDNSKLTSEVNDCRNLKPVDTPHEKTTVEKQHKNKKNNTDIESILKGNKH
jgi:hypothetical protein